MIRWLLALALMTAPPPDGFHFVLKPGARKTIPLGPVTRLSLGNAEVADVVPASAEEVTLRGLAKGRTTLIVWRPNGNRSTYEVIVGDIEPPRPPPEPKRSPELDCWNARTLGQLRAQEAIRAHRYRDALRVLQKEAKESPHLAQVQLQLGSTYARLGRAEEGAHAYEAFVVSCPTHPSSHMVRKLLADYRRARRMP